MYRSSSMLSEYGTQPQLVQQHMQHDLGYGMPVQGMTGHYGAQNQGFGNYQSTMNQGEYIPVGTLSQYGTPTHLVQNHIQQDIPYGHHQAPSYTYGGASSHMYGPSTSQGYGQYGMHMNSGIGAMSTMQNFGSSPQLVQQHIQHDLGSVGLRNVHYGSQHMPQHSYIPQTYPMNQGLQPFHPMLMGGQSTLQQFSTPVQQVQQHVQQDLRGMGQIPYGTAMQHVNQPMMHRSLAQFGSYPSTVQQHIRNDIGSLPY